MVACYSTPAINGGALEYCSILCITSSIVFPGGRENVSHSLPRFQVDSPSPRLARRQRQDRHGGQHRAGEVLNVDHSLELKCVYSINTTTVRGVESAVAFIQAYVLGC